MYCLIVSIIATWSIFRSFKSKKGNKATNTQGEILSVGKYEKNKLLKREENKRLKDQELRTQNIKLIFYLHF